jgi:hypothetical protein
LIVIRYALLGAALSAVLLTATTSVATASSTGSGGPLADQLNQSFTGSKYTSKYHLYAAGLDWSKPVGLMIYADGSEEWGLKHPNSDYLLAGSNGLHAVAKRHNMILLTPFSPNKNCDDGGSCWYYGDSPGYTKWAEQLTTWVESRYNVEKDRVAFGGYSSGAQLATEWWVPSGAAQRTMTDGVIVAISYGGSPKMPFTAPDPVFQGKVSMRWDTGDKDDSYKQRDAYGSKAGEKWYRQHGWSTEWRIVPGQDHDRDGQFGDIMDRAITTHIG